MNHYAHDTAARTSMRYARRPKQRRVRLTDHIVLMIALLAGLVLLGAAMFFMRGR